MTYQIKTIKTQKGLDQLYNSSAFTFVGFDTESDNIEALVDALKDRGFLKDDIIKLSLVKGQTMNHLYELTEQNKYPADLNIVAIELKYLKDIPRLAIFRLNVDARWFDDIVDNNQSREDVMLKINEI